MKVHMMADIDATSAETVDIARNYRPVAIRAVLAACSVKPQIMKEKESIVPREPALVARLLSE
jgi:hypothetical protein